MQVVDFTNKSDNATVANFTASHENKIVLIFCHKTKCGTTWEDCYCCINKKPEELCYDTMNECRSNCPICDPKCPPTVVCVQQNGNGDGSAGEGQ